MTIVTVLLTAVTVNGYSSSLWDGFLQNPTSNNFNILKSKIIALSQVCDQKTQLTYLQTDKLFSYVTDGNSSAFRAALLISSCFDGGDLEDYDRSVGVYFTKHPNDFLAVVCEERISNENVNDMITMLPLSLVDDFNAQRAEISKRIALLKAIHDPKYQKLINKLRTYLEQSEKLLPAAGQPMAR